MKRNSGADWDVTFELEKGDCWGSSAPGAGKVYLAESHFRHYELFPPEENPDQRKYRCGTAGTTSGFDGDLTVGKSHHLPARRCWATPARVMDQTHTTRSTPLRNCRIFRSAPSKTAFQRHEEPAGVFPSPVWSARIFLILDEVLSVGDGSFTPEGQQ